MRLAAFLPVALMLAACGEGPATPPETAPAAPVIATDMVNPVEDPFCTFTAENAETSGEEIPYVFVTSIGDSVYHGYAKLDDTVRELTEIEAGFGAGLETRRYVTDDDSIELEVILLTEQERPTATEYTGSVRVIYPVEGEAVKFYGECQAED